MDREPIPGPRTTMRVALGIAIVVAVSGCVNSDDGADMTDPMPTLDEVTSEQWQALAERRIFFGHQSVGGNVIDGVEELLEENGEIPLSIVETSDPAEMSEPALYHARIGRNGAPATKLAAFSDIVSGGAMNESGTAMVKYCYVDIVPGTDPEALFNAYRKRIDSLRAHNPDLTIVHITLPLRADRGTVKYWAARVRGLTTERQLNWIRHQYNELMRETYAGEPIFDLARFESMRPDGRATMVRYKGQRVPVLAAGWTHDGGHLNEDGRRRAAEAFLATLAQL